MKTLEELLNESLLGDEEDMINDEWWLTAQQWIEKNLAFYRLPDDIKYHNHIVDIINGNFILKNPKTAEPIPTDEFTFGKANAANMWNCEWKNLNGMPKILDDDLMLSLSNNIKDLTGAPIEIHGNIYADRCENLTSLKGCPQKGEINTIDLSLDEKLTSLKYCPDNIYLLIATKCHGLKNLEGVQKVQCLRANMCKNLTSLKGLEKAKGKLTDINVESCPNLLDINHIPQYFYEYISFRNCPLITDDVIRAIKKPIKVLELNIRDTNINMSLSELKKYFDYEWLN